jgi:hypothetical protein
MLELVDAMVSLLRELKLSDKQQSKSTFLDMVNCIFLMCRIQAYRL